MQKLLLSMLLPLLLSGCGTITGLPSHGGGKRFAVEQELVAASVRASAKDLDLSALKGRKVALIIAMMGDQGAGNLVGGRYGVDALIRGDFVNTPTTSTTNEYPIIDTTTTTVSGASTSTTTAQNALNAPRYSRSQADGTSSTIGGGVRYQGQGDFRNETLITNPRDAVFLTHILQTVFFLRGIEIVAPGEEDIDVFITVDVFGTIRSRNDWHLLNQEHLAAKTAMEVFAIDTHTKEMIVKPTTSSFEALYTEQYALWMGPLETIKTVKRAGNLLVDFSDMDTPTHASHTQGIASPLAFAATPAVSASTIPPAEASSPPPLDGQSLEVQTRRRDGQQ